MTVIEKVFREKRFKILLIDSTPAYVEYTQAELVKAVKKQYTELEGIYSALSDHAKETGVKLGELSEEAADSIFGDPFSLLYFAGSENTNAKAKQARNVSGLSKSSLTVLGADSAKQRVEATLNALRKTFVIGEDKKQRLHAMHVLVENALVNSVPCIIFGSSEESLKGLAMPNNKSSEFKAMDLPEISNGFPLKTYATGQVLIDLKDVNAESLAVAFGFEKSPDTVKVFTFAMQGSSSLEEIASKIQLTPTSKEVTTTSINKADRVLRVMKKAYPSTFGKNSSQELFDLPKVQVGRIAYVECPKQNELAALMITSLVKNIFPSEPYSVLVAVEEDAGKLSIEALSAIEEAAQRNVGISLNASHELDFGPVKNPSLKIDIIQGAAIASEEGSEKKRFTLRPAYSHCNEMQAAGTLKKN